MKEKGYDWAGIHRDHKGGPFRFFLKILSALYGIGVSIRLWMYRCGLLKGQRLPVFVVSIGNITSGGTGKTPAVHLLAGWALEQGYRPAVLSRGYGGQFKGKVLEVSNREGIRTSQEKSGDEPYLLARALPGIPVIVSRNRYHGGLRAIEKYSSDFLILDDGFQHLELQRDFNIVLLDASNPFGNGRLLPRGPLREPVTELKRADCCIMSHSKGSDETLTSGRLTTDRLPDVPVFHSDHVPVEAIFPESGEHFKAGLLQGKRVVAFAGIAHPGYFKETLESLGSEVVYFKPFGDHHRYHAREIQALVSKKGTLNAHYTLTTAKDWVKVDAVCPGDETLGYVEIAFTLLGHGEAFFEMVKKRFDDFEKK